MICRKTEGRFSIETKKLCRRNINTKDIEIQADQSKYENYFEFKMPVQFVKPHQVSIVLSISIQSIDIKTSQIQSQCFCTVYSRVTCDKPWIYIHTNHKQNNRLFRCFKVNQTLQKSFIHEPPKEVLFSSIKLSLSLPLLLRIKKQ